MWAVYLAEAAVSKLFPSRGNALKDDMLKKEYKKMYMAETQNGQNKNLGTDKKA